MSQIISIKSSLPTTSNNVPALIDLIPENAKSDNNTTTSTLSEQLLYGTPAGIGKPVVLHNIENILHVPPHIQEEVDVSAYIYA